MARERKSLSVNENVPEISVEKEPDKQPCEAGSGKVMEGLSEGKKMEEQPDMPKVKESAKEQYRIVCRNPINESFGGVNFQNGTAFTKDAFTASWFGNKDGYTVYGERES